MPVRLEPSRLAYGKHFDWREGLTDTLFAIAPTQVNGLAIIPSSEIDTRFNYFGAISRFFGDAALADVPSSIRPVYGLVEELVRDWAVTGEFCVIAMNGELIPIRSDYVFPQRNAHNRRLIDGYLFVFPEVSEETLVETGNARVVAYDSHSGLARQWNAAYTLGVLDRPENAVDVNIESVHWVETGDGVYPQIAPLIREINVRMSVMQSALNSTTLPILQASLDGIGQTRATPAELTLARLATLARSGLGIIIPPPFAGEEPARFLERNGTGLNESMDYIRLLLGQLSVVSGVPDYVFGISLSQNPADVERILFTGQSRVTRLRRSLETVLGELGYDVQFTTEPFSTRKARTDNLRQLFDAGIITLTEVREGLGYDSLVSLPTLPDMAIRQQPGRVQIQNAQTPTS